MSKLKASQVDYNGQKLSLKIAEMDGGISAAEYTHPATHDISMITNGASQSYVDAAVADKATQTYVDNAVAAVVDSAPATLNTLNELSDALGDDPNFATTVATQIGEKAANKIINSTFLSGNDQLVINDAFVVEATCVVEVIPQAEKDGEWEVSYVDGVITITSDTTESANVAVKIEVRKAGA